MGRHAALSAASSCLVLAGTLAGTLMVTASFAAEPSAAEQGGRQLAQNIPPTTAPNNPSQSAPPEKPAPAPRDQQACGQPGATLQPKGSDQNGATVGRAPSKENLSDTLAKSGGVLCPPAGTDPDIRAPATGSGSAMPVIPPPGTPGGDQSIQPK